MVMELTNGTRAVVVYESMFGNTEALAEAVALGLRNGGWNATALDVRWATNLPLDADLLVLGAPTHAFSLSRPSTRADAVRRGASPSRGETGLREWMAGIAPATESSPAVAVFDTRASKVKRLPTAAAHTLARLARRKGYRIVGRPEGFLVDDVEGPIVDQGLERAEAWGRSLAGLFAAAS